jgi:hypothetical protein
VEIDLQEQMAYLLQNGRSLLASPISSGRYGPLTKTGSFTILEKERSHYSSMYGKIVDATGKHLPEHQCEHLWTDCQYHVPFPDSGNQ